MDTKDKINFLAFCKGSAMRRIIVLVTFFAFIMSSCNNAETEIDPQIIRYSAPSVKEHYQRAEEVALNWMKDAYLTNVTISLLPENDSRGNLISFSFSSPTPVNSEYPFLLVLIDIYPDGETVTSTEEGTESLEAEGLGINIDDIASDSGEIFDFIWENGGREYFEKYGNPSTIVLLILEYETRGVNDLESLAPQWRAEFDDMSNSESWDIRINAVTNEILPPTNYGP